MSKVTRMGQRLTFHTCQSNNHQKAPSKHLHFWSSLPSLVPTVYLASTTRPWWERCFPQRWLVTLNKNAKINLNKKLFFRRNKSYHTIMPIIICFNKSNVSWVILPKLWQNRLDGLVLASPLQHNTVLSNFIRLPNLHI